MVSNKNLVENSNSIYKIFGASNHTDKEREKNNYYAIDPIATDILLSVETFSNNILEPACGEGHLSERLKKYSKNVTSYDIVDRGYGEVRDFFSLTEWNGDTIVRWVN